MSSRTCCEGAGLVFPPWCPAVALRISRRAQLRSRVSATRPICCVCADTCRLDAVRPPTSLFFFWRPFASPGTVLGRGPPLLFLDGPSTVPPQDLCTRCSSLAPLWVRCPWLVRMAAPLPAFLSSMVLTAFGIPPVLLLYVVFICVPGWNVISIRARFLPICPDCVL